MQIILNNGVKFPIIGVGTYRLREEDVLLNIIEESFKVGYRLIDTAQVYQNEEIIGEIMTDLGKYGLKREDVFVTTKLSPSNQGKGVCKKALLKSMVRLKVDYIDLVLIHFPGTAKLRHDNPQNAERRRGSWEDLEELQQEGRVRCIGVSNYTVRHLTQLLEHAKIKPVINQIEVHPLYFKRDLIEFCKKNSIVVQAYSSLGAQNGWKVLSANKTLNEVAKKYDKSLAQILLKWALQHDFCVIPKTSSAERIKENFNLFDFTISSEDMKVIDNLNENRKFCWDSKSIY